VKQRNLFLKVEHTEVANYLCSRSHPSGFHFPGDETTFLLLAVFPYTNSFARQVEENISTESWFYFIIVICKPNYSSSVYLLSEFLMACFVRFYTHSHTQTHTHTHKLYIYIYIYTYARTEHVFHILGSGKNVSEFFGIDDWCTVSFYRLDRASLVISTCKYCRR
jgi:hypothetical protein